MLTHEGDIVEQVAKTPIEVLANINKHWLAAITKGPTADYPIADQLMTVLYAMECYAEFTRTSMEDVRISNFDARVRGYVFAISVPATSTVAVQRWNLTPDQYKGRKAEQYTRTTVPNIGGCVQLLECLEKMAWRDRCDIEDYVCKVYPMWVGYDQVFVRLSLERDDSAEVDAEIERTLPKFNGYVW